MVDACWIEPAAFVRIEGSDRIDLLHRLCTADLRVLQSDAEFARCDALFTTDKGKLIDWVTLYRIGEQLLMRCSLGRGEQVRAWIDRYTIMEDVQCTSISYHLARCFGDDVAQRLQCAQPRAQDDVWLTVGPAGLGHNVEALIPGAPETWAKEHGFEVLDEQAQDYHRICLGVPSARHEYAEQVAPLELRLGPWAVSWNKGCYIGQEVISRLDSYDKVARVLMGVQTTAAIEGDWKSWRLRREGTLLGRLTSFNATQSPGVGLAITKREEARPGSVHIDTGDARVDAELVDRPFWESAP